MRTVIVIIGILAIIRIALPFVALRLINKKLSRFPDFICHIDDLDISFISRSITLRGIEMKRKNGKVDVPFFKCNMIHVHVESFKHRLSEIKVDSCVLNLVKGKTKDASHFSLDEGWIKLAKEMPLKPNTLTVNNGSIHFIEKYRSPDVDLSMEHVKVNGTNLQNGAGDSSLYPSLVTIEGDLEGAKFKSSIKLNTQKKALMLEAVSSFTPVNVQRIKNFLVLYADFDVKSGSLSASSVIKIRNNRLDGVIDPVARDLVFYDKKKDEKKKLGAKVKQFTLQVAADVLGKSETDKISTKIELHGPLDEVKVNVWQIILEGLKRSIIPGKVPEKEASTKKTKKEVRKEKRKQKRTQRKKKD